MVTSGVRLGTAAVTTRGMKETEMEAIADAIDKVLSAQRRYKERSKGRHGSTYGRIPAPRPCRALGKLMADKIYALDLDKGEWSQLFDRSSASPGSVPTRYVSGSGRNGYSMPKR